MAIMFRRGLLQSKYSPNISAANFLLANGKAALQKMHFVIYCNLYLDHADRKWVFTARNSGDFNTEEQTSKLTEIVPFKWMKHVICAPFARNTNTL